MSPLTRWDRVCHLSLPCPCVELGGRGVDVKNVSSFLLLLNLLGDHPCPTLQCAGLTAELLQIALVFHRIGQRGKDVQVSKMSHWSLGGLCIPRHSGTDHSTGVPDE